MLYNASDYKFVDTSQIGGMIHGNILPCINPLSQRAQTYFENYLFLLEAYHERMNVDKAGTNSIAPPPRTYNGRNIWDLNLNSYTLGVSNGAIAGQSLGYGNDILAYINPDTTYPANHVNTGYNEDSSYYIQNFLQNYINPCVEEKAPYYAMRPYYHPTRLLSEFIRVKFYEFHHMSKALIALRPGDWATKIVHQALKADGSVNYEYDVGLINASMSFVRGYGSGRDSQGQTVEYQLFKTIVTYKPSFFTLPYATSATLIWKCSVEVSGDSSSTRKYVWGTKSLSVLAGGAIEVPSGMLETICDDACSICGRPTTSMIDTYPFYMIVDFAFPARLNGISWNWQPTYT